MLNSIAPSSLKPEAFAPLRILIVENDPVMRLGLEQFLDSYESYEVIGQAGDGYSGLALALNLKPDLVVMDIGLPQLDGITATQQIKQNSE
ncbi:MAG: response regulator transcription factor, partial [Leptolyngbyaceae cyanobacterium]